MKNEDQAMEGTRGARRKQGRRAGTTAKRPSAGRIMGGARRPKTTTPEMEATEGAPKGRATRRVSGAARRATGAARRVVGAAKEKLEQRGATKRGRARTSAKKRTRARSTGRQGATR